MIEVAIFSYNRLFYLKNALNSVQRNFSDTRVRIYDDGSDQFEMKNYLSENSDLVGTRLKGLDSKHGGLYANMQSALDEAQEDYLLLMQDDTQIVRKIEQDDLEAINRAFEAFPNAAFLSVMFLKGEKKRRYKRVLRVDDENQLYRSKSLEDGVVQSYYDVVLCNVSRLRAAGWKFENTEVANMKKARELFGEMPIMRNPLMFFCPEVPFFRDRKQSLAARIIAKRRKVNPVFHDMTDEEVTQLAGRELSIFPYAEDWLAPTVQGLRRPFVFKDVKANLWLNLLYAVETKLLGR
jgi:glycosyltransferase involved in cell wall biosynthesis